MNPDCRPAVVYNFGACLLILGHVTVVCGRRQTQRQSYLEGLHVLPWAEYLVGYLVDGIRIVEVLMRLLFFEVNLMAIVLTTRPVKASEFNFLLTNDLKKYVTGIDGRCYIQEDLTVDHMSRLIDRELCVHLDLAFTEASARVLKQIHWFTATIS